MRPIVIAWNLWRERRKHLAILGFHKNKKKETYFLNVFSILSVVHTMRNPSLPISTAKLSLIGRQ